MLDRNIKSIRYPVAIDGKLEKLALKFGRSKLELFKQMVNYFDKSKKDPSDLNDEVLKKEMTNGISRILSFIRKQEEDFLLPTFIEAGLSTKILKQHTVYIKELLERLIKEEQQTAKILARIALLDNSIAKTQIYHEERAKLKAKCEEIFEYYIIQREALSWTASAVKKEELQNQVRRSLKNL
jgi:preprotein translocase subunit SecA